MNFLNYSVQHCLEVWQSLIGVIQTLVLVHFFIPLDLFLDMLKNVSDCKDFIFINL